VCILLADSGSTKTSWKVIMPSGEVSFFRTAGLNPNFLSRNEIIDIVQNELLCNLDVLVEEIRFYGAGCSQHASKEKLRDIFSTLFPSAKRVVIDTDLMGAIEAMNTKHTSWVCILGTGTNACIVENGKIVHQITSLGYMFGDEGSGFDIGKRLVKAYFSGLMPLELKKKWDDMYQLTYSELIEKVYQGSKPNAWVASFAIFAKKNIEHPFIENLVLASFESFLTSYILTLKGYYKFPIHFVGSVAYYFEDQLKKVLNKHGLIMGDIMLSPLS